MSLPVTVFLVAALFWTHQAVRAQEGPRPRKPLMVSHLSAENRLLLRRPAAPRHSIFSKLVCFKAPCRKYIGWRQRQRSMRFKGYKDGGKVPRPVKEPVLENDTLPIVKNNEPVHDVPMTRDTLSGSDRIFVLDEVLFEVNSARFNKKFMFRLDSLVQLLIRHQNLRAAISGHTDNTGSPSHNLMLSNERAAAVADYLVKNSISPHRISHQGLGSTRPIADNRTQEGRRKNRRVEILLSE